MNLEKLKDLEAEFLDRYPKGFEDAHFFPTMKNFRPEKLEEFAKDALKKENFSNPNLAVEGFFQTETKRCDHKLEQLRKRYAKHRDL